MLPGLPWHVHDPARPYPPVVTPGSSPGAPPSDAIVLFDGADLSRWVQHGPKGERLEAKWPVRNGHFETASGTGPLATRESYGDLQLHIEWAAPVPVQGEGQGRGNSGVFLMGLYEVQVLDSHDSATYADGQAAALYGQWPPLSNAARKPGEWQTYDIVFQAPRFKNGKLVSPPTRPCSGTASSSTTAGKSWDVLSTVRSPSTSRTNPNVPSNCRITETRSGIETSG